MDTVTYLDGPMGVTEKIKKAMYDVCRTYLYIGFLLDEVKRYEYYKEKEYIDVYDYARQELGFKKSSAKNFIAIFNTFCLEQKGIKTMFLKDKYEHFNYSQLCEMLSLNEKQREKVSPDMTVREIRALKKELPGQTSGQIISINTKTVQTNLSSPMAQRLESYAKSSGFSVDLIIENALSQYFEMLDSKSLSNIV